MNTRPGTQIVMREEDNQPFVVSEGTKFCVHNGSMLVVDPTQPARIIDFDAPRPVARVIQ
jgi:hypothetical protein